MRRHRTDARDRAWSIDAVRAGLVALGCAALAIVAAPAQAQPQSLPKASGRFRPLVVHDPEPPMTVQLDRPPVEARGYYTGRRPYRVGPGLRLSPGAAFGLTDAPVLAATFDVIATGRIGLAPGDVQWVLVPEGGASWSGALGGTYLVAGLGLGRGTGEERPASEARAIFGGFSYVPRFVHVTGGRVSANGLRHGILWDHGETTLGLEASHEVLFLDDGGVRHALRLMASIDVGRLLWLVAGDR